MRIAIVLALCAAVGCDKEGIVEVTVDATTTVSGIASLRVTVTHEAVTSQAVVFRPSAPITIPPPQTLALGLPSDRTGPISVTVDAFDSNNQVITSGKASGVAESGKSTPLRVTLTRKWVAQSSGTSDPLIGIWGDGMGRIVAVGGSNNGPRMVTTTNGGTSWSNVASGATYLLTDVWGSTSDDVYAVGFLDVVHWDGTSWKTQTKGTTEPSLAIWGSHPTDVYIGGPKGFVLQSTDHGTTWSMKNLGISSTLAGLGGTSSANIIGVGPSGLIVRSTDSGTNWTQRTSGTTKNLVGIWAHKTGIVFVVGTGGAILYSDTGGSQWAVQNSGTTDDLYGVWGSAPNDVYIVGMSGTILHSTNSGQTWTPMPSGTTEFLKDIWGSGPDNVYAVGSNGTILHLQ